MSISSVGAAAPPLPVPASAPAPTQRNDHDGDDKGAVSAALPPGVGAKVDVRA